ncbi:Spo0E family sporulation regulatory protein-aspartic acid phosphatase [Dethiothermospora halolimnae]|uniref:Spo0E family sporulation regulatory protein-aspartic acid phosphatase n=1 Tax=Dethiothermospora halolimnae TaxID=3114390 RepID=UPI003CCB9B26
MSEKEKIEREIEVLRLCLNVLIRTKKGNMLDGDVIKASQLLDDAITEYLKLLNDEN